MIELQSSSLCRRNYIFWSDLTSKKIIQANLDGSDQKVIVSDGLSLAGMPPKDNQKTELVAHANPQAFHVLVHHSHTLPIFSFVDGLAWDWMNSKLYWTDSKGYEIEVFDILTGHRRTLIDTGIKSIPRGIIVDPNTRCYIVISVSGVWIKHADEVRSN